MIKLRGENGCPWDREQTHKSLIKYLVEETYELVDAIESDDDEQLLSELGDLLLQVIFHCQIAREDRRFNLQDVARYCCRKMIRRHPHVFGNKVASNSAEVLKQWEDIKREEPENTLRKSVLDGIPKSLPPLAKAEKVQVKVSKIGFDWTSSGDVLDKIQEEFEEVRGGLDNRDDRSIREELGDLMFAVVNLCRYLDNSPDELLREATEKFSRRFRFMEARIVQEGMSIEECSMDLLDRLWQEAKAEV